VSVIDWDNKPEWADVWIEDLAQNAAVIGVVGTAKPI
jgi:hypothetical protein